MKKYIYARENNKVFVIICLIMGILFGVLGIYLMIELAVAEIVYAIFGCVGIVFIIMFVSSLNALKWCKWHRMVKQNGLQVDGKVVNFHYRYRPHHMGNPSSEEHWLEVEYVEPSGEVRRKNTPVLTFAPEKRDDVTCKVYINGDDVLATDFVNLKRKKTSWGEIICILFVVILAIVACIHAFG